MHRISSPNDTCSRQNDISGLLAVQIRLKSQSYKFVNYLDPSYYYTFTDQCRPCRPATERTLDLIFSMSKNYTFKLEKLAYLLIQVGQKEDSLHF